MKRVIIWGMGDIFAQNVNLIKYHEILENFQVIGVTSNNTVYKNYYGYNYIKKENLKRYSFDFVIVMADGNMFLEITEEAEQLGISKERVFNWKVFRMQNLNIEEYIQLKRNAPSIISNMCWGGFTYNVLGLEFKSPFINMFIPDEDYLKLLECPQRYMSEELQFLKMKYNSIKNIEYPVAICRDIRLHFSYCETFEEAKGLWEKRKTRIDWNNLFVMMCTESRDCAEKFAKLPYKRKVCFVPFEMDGDSFIHVKFREDKYMADMPFSRIVNAMAVGTYPYYDVFDLLEYGIFTPLTELAEVQ